MTAMASPKQVSQINRINALANPDQSMAVRIAMATAFPTTKIIAKINLDQRKMEAAQLAVAVVMTMIIIMMMMMMIAIVVERKKSDFE
jgi:Kef-type K+ transport system membrane component KefB